MKNAFKKVFTGAVAVMTIVWSVGIMAVTPTGVQAASAGDVIKGTTLSTVYYYGTDGSRYAFPNEKTYFSWYTDFSDVQTISDSELAAIPLAGNIVYRPGSRWIKIQSDPKTYAVTTEGSILWVETEEVAQGLAGADWNAFIDDVPDTFFVDYTVGNSLTSATDAYEGALVAVDTSIYMVWDGEKLLVSDAGMTSNGLQARFVLDGSGVDLAGMTAGADLASENIAMTDSAQLGGAVAVGGLSVSLASDSAGSTTLLKGVTNAPVTAEFATFKMTATEGAATLDQLLVKLGGVGATTNISNVYLYEGDTRLTNGRSINSTTRLATFSALNLDFTDGETKYITVRADISSSPTAGDTAYFSIVDASDVVTDSSVSGNFPVSGNTMTFSNTAAGYLTITTTGSVANPTIGTDDSTIGKFKFAATSEDASLNSVAFTVKDATDHDNFKLYNGSTLLGSGVVSDNVVTFDLATAVAIRKGGSETLTLKADIGGQSADHIYVYIENPTDVSAIGGTYGFNMGINNIAVDAQADGYDLTIQGGDLTFAFNGPSSANISIDSFDQVLMKFTVTAANWTEVQHLPFIIIDTNGTDDTYDGLINTATTPDEANFTNFTVREADGTVWMGPAELVITDTDDTQTLTFNDYQDLQAGESKDLMLTVNVANNTAASFTTTTADKIKATIDVSLITAEDANGDALTNSSDITPTADLAGYNMTITNSSLTIVASTPPSAATYVIGTASVPLVGYSFTAGSSDSVTVTDATYIIGGDNDSTFSNEHSDMVVNDHISSCSIYDNVTGVLVDGPEGISASTALPTTATYSVSFGDFSWSVAAGETQKLVLKCNLANVALTSTTTNTYKAALEATSNVATVTAENGSGSSVSATYTTADVTYTALPSAVPQLSVVASGSLTVAKATDAPTATIVLGSSTGVSVAKYKFTATNEAFVVDQLHLVNSLGTTYDRAVNTVTISYTNSAGATETKTGYLSNAIVDFGGLDLYVPTTESRYMTVTVDTNTVSSTGATSADTFDLDIDMASETMQAVGQGSGTTIYSGTDTGINDATDMTDIDGSTMTLYKTKPTISLASGSPSGAGIPGLNEVFRFNIAADSRGYVTLNEVAFKMTSTDNTGTPTGWNKCVASGTGIEDGDLSLYNVADMTELEGADTNWTFYDSADGAAVCTAGTDVIDYIKLDLTTPDVVGAGTTKTYALYMDTTGASSANDDSLRIDLDTETNTDAGILTATGNHTINWEDDSNGDDVGASFIKTLPVTGGTIVY